MRFCQERPQLSVGHLAAASVEAWRGFSMKGHRCSGWVYSSLFYVIMRIYSYPLLLNSRKYFAFMAEPLVPEKHQSSPCFWHQQSEEKCSLPQQHWTRGELCPAPAQPTPQTQSVFTVLVWVNVTLLLPRPRARAGGQAGS